MHKVFCDKCGCDITDEEIPGEFFHDNGGIAAQETFGQEGSLLCMRVKVESSLDYAKADLCYKCVLGLLFRRIRHWKDSERRQNRRLQQMDTAAARLRLGLESMR